MSFGTDSSRGVLGTVRYVDFKPSYATPIALLSTRRFCLKPEWLWLALVDTSAFQFTGPSGSPHQLTLG